MSKNKLKNANSNKVHRYTFRLSEEQNTEFLKLVEAAGCSKNKSHYIVGRLLD